MSGWDVELATADSEPGDPADHWLAPPHEAHEVRRRWFRPRRGWFRRLERRVAHALAQFVYPRMPGLARPYSRQLRRSLELREADIELAGLPPEFDGYSMLLVTDVHAGPFVDRATLIETMRRLSAVNADTILLGGDLVTSRIEELDDAREAFAELQAEDGVYAVLGNHDHYTGVPTRIVRGLEQVGITVLQNRSVDLVRGAARLSLAGVDDTLIGRPDLGAALDGTTAPVVLLSHNPDLFFEAARRGVALTLSGHTHAGQIRLPRMGVIVRQSRYRLDEGRFRHGASELLVSRGLGAVGVPLRVHCRPEAVLIHLRRSRA